MMNKNEYYVIKNINLAKALVFITGEKYYTYDDLKGDGKIYTFKDTKKFRKALTYLNDIRRELSN